MLPVAYTLINSVRAPTDMVFAALTDPVRMRFCPARDIWLAGAGRAEGLADVLSSRCCRRIHDHHHSGRLDSAFLSCLASGPLHRKTQRPAAARGDTQELTERPCPLRPRSSLGRTT